MAELEAMDDSSTTSLGQPMDIEQDDEGNAVNKSKYQKENVFIHLLPYYNELEEDTSKLLEKTLVNLSKSIVGRDILNGFSYYAKSMGTYIDRYGRKFTKAQHVKLVELCIEVLTMETIPLAAIHDVTELLQTLLKKPELLTRDDLVIAWRPLYETLDRFVYHRKYSLSLNANTKLEYWLRETVRLCSLYFPSDSVQEIIDEFSPMLCPSSIKMSFGLDMLRYFLPFKNSEPQCQQKLIEFVHFLLSFCETWNNNPHWEWSMMNLLSTASWSMTGKIDWNPYLPKVYARLMRNLNLPVYFKSAQNNGSHNSSKIYECESVTRWIVSTLGNNDEAMKYLKMFMKSLETYYNPANTGSWTMFLPKLLRELASNFTLRLKRERYLEKKRWWSHTPEDMKLTESDIDQFVEVLSRVALDFYLDLPLGGYALRYLAVLRPSVIIPAVMEKYSGMVETLTESKKYMTTLRWNMILLNLIISSRQEDEGYDGRSLVIPFITSLLPAIDSNDMVKTLTALSCLCIVLSYINVVDSSPLADTIEDEVEREICHGTGGFDDFVIQLLDRVFTLIENRTHENTRMADSRIVHNVNMEDIALQKIIWAVFRPLAMHSSTAICKVAVDKIVSFALSNTLETDVSGKLFACICQSYAVSRPDIILPKLLPQLCRSIELHITDDILDDEDLDKTLLFHLLLLSYILETIGTNLLNYKEEIESMLTAVLKLNGKKGYVFACFIFMRLLNSLVLIYPLENKLYDCDYDDPNYLGFKDWGKFVHWRDTKVQWHIPSLEELTWAKEIFLSKFMEYSKIFENISQLQEGSETLNKKLLKGIQVLEAGYDGICVLLPFWNEEPLVPKDSVVDFSGDSYNFGLPHIDITIPGTGENVKLKYFKIYTEIQAYLEKFKADDTEAFVNIIRGFDSLIAPNISTGNRYIVSAKDKSMPMTAPTEISSLDPRKRYIRFKSIVRAYSIHMKRVRCASCSSWTQSHLEVLEKLFSLCVNRYARVRSVAQQKFCRYIDWSAGFLCRYTSSYMMEKLKEGVPHHEYKGTLYTIQLCKCSPILVNSWEQLRNMWMALVRSPFSEKNTIIVCMQNLQNILARDFVFIPFEDKIPENSRALTLARELVTESQWKSQIEGKVQPLDMSESINHYNKLIDGLLEYGPDSNNHWRKQVLSADMLSVLIVQEVPIRREIVEFFFGALISQHIDIRRIGLNAIPWILSLFKRKYKTINLNTRTGIKLENGETIRSVLQYKSNGVSKKYHLEFENDVNVAKSSSINLVVHKQHLGFTALPVIFPIKISPENFQDLSDQNEGSTAVLNATSKYLNNEEYLKKLLALWSIEDKTKGNASKRTGISKLIARNNGPEVLTLLLELLTPMAKDKDQWKQRCVSNIIGGIIYGMKLWSDETTLEFWTTKLEPIVTGCLNNVTQETFDYWVSSISVPTNNRDGNKMRFFIQFLQKRFIKSLETAQTTSVDAHNNMTFFDLAVSNVQWRGGDLFAEIFASISKYFIDKPIPYRNVRVQLGRLLGNVYEWNLETFTDFGVDLQTPCNQFLTNVMDALSNIVEESGKFQANDLESEENAEARNLLLKFKTVLEWINCACWDLEATVHSKFYCFIPWLCHFESYDPDPEIAHLATVALAGLSKHLIRPEHVDTLLDSLNTAASSSSWKARLCVLEFLKVFALSNASIIASNEVWSNRVANLVLSLLAERKLEVRELASRILCGFLHCLLVPRPMELLKHFKDEVQRCMKKRKMANKDSPGSFSRRVEPEEVDRAHSAVLGICAFVDTHPYDVPDFLPDVLVYLTTHLHDCQPIPTTIRKCLSNFRRTHHDNWAVHKLKFSEDQLCTLTDVFVSPCYYA